MTNGRDGGGMGQAVALALAGLVALAVLGLIPRPDSSRLAVLVPPWVDAGRAFATVAGLALPIVDAPRGGRVFVIATPDQQDRQRLLRAGFLVVALPAAGLCGPAAGSSELEKRS